MKITTEVRSVRLPRVTFRFVGGTQVTLWEKALGSSTLLVAFPQRYSEHKYYAVSVPRNEAIQMVRFAVLTKRVKEIIVFKEAKDNGKQENTPVVKAGAGS